MSLVKVQKLIRIVSIVQLVCLVYSFYLKILKRRQRFIPPAKRSRDFSGIFNSCFTKIIAGDGDAFVKATRMSVSKFNLLLSHLKPRLELDTQKRPIKPEIRLAITLMYLAHGCNVQILGWRFKMGASTVREIVYKTCVAIWEQLNEIHVAPPNIEEWKNVAQGFWNKTKMPNCVGAIDAKQIKVKYPARSDSLSSKNRKQCSIVLMAACDTRYRFTLVDIGAVGSQRDGGVFAGKSVGRKILNGTYVVPKPQNLPLENIVFPHYFIGDAAFPLKPSLMRPYFGQSLSQERNQFNETLSKTRLFIENAFGILASRWKVLGSDLCCEPKIAYKIILATVVLHNFLIVDRNSGYLCKEQVDREEDGEVIPGQWREEGVGLVSTRIFRTNRTTTAAFSLRDTLTKYLLRNA